MNIDWGVMDELEKPIKRFKHKVLDSDYEDFKSQVQQLYNELNPF